MSFLRAFFGLIFTSAVLLFAAANLHSVEVFYTPFTPAITLPLYLIGLGLMGLGFVAGGIIVWINEGKARRDRRRQRKEIKNLQKELGTIEHKAASQTPPADFFPALPNTIKK